MHRSKHVTPICCLLTLLLTCAAFADDWAEVQQILTPIKGVATTQISNVVTPKYTAGMLMGNGQIGVVAGDTLTSQKFYFGKSNFLGLARNERQNRWENSILPIGSLLIKSPQSSEHPESVYHMEQDILDAEVRTTLQLGPTVVHLRSWTADSDDIFVTEISSDAKGSPVTLDIELAQNNNPLYPHTASVDNNVLCVTRGATSARPNMSTTTEAGDAPRQNVFQSRVAVAMRAIGADLIDGRIIDGAAQASTTLEPGKPLLLVVSVRSDAAFGGSLKTVDTLKDDAKGKVAQIDPATVARLLDEHHEWWKNFWLRSYVHLNDDVLERYYYGALYVLGCSARKDHVLPLMWGMWLTTDMPAWGGRHFFNYNAQAPYYGVCSSNRPEMILPYAEFVTKELPYQINRTHAAGYQGATFTRSYAPYDLFRAAPAIEPVAAQKDWRRLPTDQKSNGDFGAMPMIMYWQYTRDTQFLREQLYPLLKQLDLFWRDYMNKEPTKDGGYRYVIRHSGAHEYPGAAAADDVNPNLDVGFFRYNTRMLIEASKELGVDGEMLPAWQDVLDHLPDYPIGIYDGKECFETAESVRGGNGRKMEPGNQPVNMEGAVHPAENVALGGDPRLVQIGLNTLAHMQSWGLAGGSANNGFCKVWPIAARLGWPADDLIDRFKLAIQHLWRETNLTCFQGGGGIETSGSIDAINCMLLQANNGELRVFPVWPKNRDASFKRLRAKGAFVVSSSLRNGQVEYVDITSEKGGEIKVICLWPDRKITLNTQAGQSYHLVPSAN